LTNGATLSSPIVAANAGAERISSHRAGISRAAAEEDPTAMLSAVTMAGATPPRAQPVLYDRLKPVCGAEKCLRMLKTD
jgi:hypothetical protein